MSDKSIHELIKLSFPSANKESWQAAATLEIDGKNPTDALAWSEHELAFLAYYDKLDIPAHSKQNNFQLSPSIDQYSGPRAWVNMPSIIVASEKEANANALSQLAAGADGILFDIRTNTKPNLDLLLNQIDWPYCSISFRANSNNSISESLSKYILEKKYDSSALSGTLFWDDDVEKNNLSGLDLLQLEKFLSCGLMVNPSTPVKEISEALTKGVRLLDRLIEIGIDASIAIQQIAFSLPISTNFFIEIAKLKALRMLWFQIAQAYGQEGYRPSYLHIHIRSEVWTNSAYQPNANMLKSTTASLAAALGGCNSLTVYAEDDNSTMNRIARNISNVLREESYIDKVADAISGAYAIEKMIDEIAQASWLEFQQQIKQS
ncbi:MAG: methylmalonyl-CoA mutase family protein [Chryseolinea sp.]